MTRQPGDPRRSGARAGGRVRSRGRAAAGAMLLILAVSACTAVGPNADAGGGPPDPSGQSAPSVDSKPSEPATSAGVPPGPSAGSATGGPAPEHTVLAVDLAADAPDEASGLLTLPGTDDRGVPGRYLTVDDDDGPLELVALDQTGAVVGRTRVESADGAGGVEAVNPEALAPGPCPDGSCVYVGDIGFTQRRTVTVHRLPLDQVAADGTAGEPAAATVAAESWDYRWPEEPQDAEAMLIEPDGSVLIVEKIRNEREPRPARLFRGPAGGGDLTAVAEFTLPAPTAPLRTLVTGNVVTDAAVDEQRVLLLTYDQVIEYRDPQGRAREHPADFPTWSHRNLPLPSSAQAEGIAATPDGCGYAVISETGPSGWNSPVGRLSVSSCP